MKLDTQTVAEIEEGRAQLDRALSYAHDAMGRVSHEGLPPPEAVSIELCYTKQEFEAAATEEAAFADLKQRIWNLMKASPHFQNAEAIFQKFANAVWPRIKIDKAKLPPVVEEPAKPFKLTDRDMRIMRTLAAIDQKYRRH